MTNVLFVTWDGPGSTYLTGLFLPIFRSLAGRGFQFHVLQFAWGAEEETIAVAVACAEAGVRYRRVRVWRRPVAFGSVATAIAGIAAVRRAISDWSIDLLMPRSYLPALAAIPARRTSGGKLPVLLDADGLPNDERLEFAGGSSGGMAHRLLSALERYAMRSADAITVRTTDAIDILRKRAGGRVPAERFTVVANARDSGLFRPATLDERRAGRERLGIAETAPLVVFAGTALTGKYCGEMVRQTFGYIHRCRPDSRLMFIMPDLDEARALMTAEPTLAAATIYFSAAPADVPALIGLGDLGLSLIRSTPAMRAASAVKTAEYLLCGVPVLATPGVGGIEHLLDDNAGLCLPGEDQAALEEAAHWFCNTVLTDRQRFSDGARRLGLDHFSLDRAVPAYEVALRLALARGKEAQ